MICASLCAGIKTVTVTGPWNTPRVSAMTIFGASGIFPASSERRAAVAMCRSTMVTVAAATRATTIAMSTVASVGAWVS